METPTSCTYTRGKGFVYAVVVGPMTGAEVLWVRMVLVNGLAFAVGWSDVLCLLQYQAFGTMMTGNTIFLAQSLVQRHPVDALFYASLIVCFSLGQILYQTVDSRVSRGAATLLSPVVFGLTLVEDMLVYIFPNSRFPLCLLGTVLGLVTALATEIDGVVVNVVTGHIQRITKAIYLRKREDVSVAVLFSFFLGVCGATVLVESGVYDNNKPLPIFTPLGTVFGLLFCLHDKHVRETITQIAQNTPRRLLSRTRSAPTPSRVVSFEQEFSRQEADNPPSTTPGNGDEA